MAGSYTSLEVRWWAPAGGPALTGYELRYREHPGGAWTDWPHDGTAAEATITGLKVNTAYHTDTDLVAFRSEQSNRTARCLERRLRTRHGLVTMVPFHPTATKRPPPQATSHNTSTVAVARAGSQ